ncbi:hypothetical protein [Methylibium rhizosphaerae]|uniref:hypothetical protein n=1 Tax=Methylibium rhizosphaerae TaxID=2570323 RepID=UPI0011281223|nr:hypothetical protein [Methylibium rhizosphaerae]
MFQATRAADAIAAVAALADRALTDAWIPAARHRAAQHSATAADTPASCITPSEMTSAPSTEPAVDAVSATALAAPARSCSTRLAISGTVCARRHAGGHTTTVTKTMNASPEFGTAANKTCTKEVDKPTPARPAAIRKLACTRAA